MSSILTFTVLAIFHLDVFAVYGLKDNWEDVECDKEYSPENCDFDKIPLLTVEDYERCAPAKLPLFARNYYVGWAGRGVTYKDNREAFDRIKIRPKMLRDTSDNSLEISTLGQKIAFPVGISPSVFHKLADPQGEIATASAASAMDTIMILGSFSSFRLEDVAAAVKESAGHLWIQTYIFENRSFTLDIVRRAENSGFKAIVLTADSNFVHPLLCNAREDPGIASLQSANIPEGLTTQPAVMTFNDIKWLKRFTKLPIVAKGILTGDDAKRAIEAGASAILVSNHGGRQLDSVQASIDALPEVVEAVNKMKPRRDVYLDSGIRNGYDVYKGLARGAKMVFIGRPAVWGLTLGGENGVKNVLNILKVEFNNTMILSGHSYPSEIHKLIHVQSLHVCQALDRIQRYMCDVE